MPTDFSQCRPELWPTLARELYEVYEVHPACADVKERSPQRVRIISSGHGTHSHYGFELRVR
jgi:hypothetical protein